MGRYRASRQGALGLDGFDKQFTIPVYIAGCPPAGFGIFCTRDCANGRLLSLTMHVCAIMIGGHETGRTQTHRHTIKCAHASTRRLHTLTLTTSNGFETQFATKDDDSGGKHQGMPSLLWKTDGNVLCSCPRL